MEFPEQLMYTKDHEWISADSGEATIGVTSYAIEQLGDIVHLELPEVGESFEAGDSFGTIESTKTVSDLYCPASGKVVEVNKEVVDSPEKIQEDPFDKGWLIKLDVSQKADNLMDAEEYENFCKEED